MGCIYVYQVNPGIEVQLNNMLGLIKLNVKATQFHETFFERLYTMREANPAAYATQHSQTT